MIEHPVSKSYEMFLLMSCRDLKSKEEIESLVRPYFFSSMVHFSSWSILIFVLFTLILQDYSIVADSKGVLILGMCFLLGFLALYYLSIAMLGYLVFHAGFYASEKPIFSTRLDRRIRLFIGAEFFHKDIKNICRPKLSVEKEILIKLLKIHKSEEAVLYHKKCIEARGFVVNADIEKIKRLIESSPK